MLSSELTEYELQIIAEYEKIAQFAHDVLLGKHPRVKVQKGMELQAWMTYQTMARAEVMERYPTLYSDLNSASEFVNLESDVGQLLEANPEEVTTRKEEATRRVREKLEALMKRQEEAKAIKREEETGNSTLDLGLTPQVNGSNENITNLALVHDQQCVSEPEEEFEEKQERGLVLWKEAPMNQIQEDMVEALEAAELDDMTKTKVRGKLDALWTRKVEMKELMAEAQDGLSYEESVAIAAFDGVDDKSLMQIVGVVGSNEGGNAADFELASCTDMVQWQGQHEDVVAIEEGVECMNLAAE